MIDRDNFDIIASYRLAGRVYWKNFAYRYNVAPNLKEELVQEAVTRLFELSGKKSTTSKYSDNYARFWIAHNAMLSFMKTWLKQIRYKYIWRDTKEIVKNTPELAVYL